LQGANDGWTWCHSHTEQTSAASQHSSSCGGDAGAKTRLQFHTLTDGSQSSRINIILDNATPLLADIHR